MTNLFAKRWDGEFLHRHPCNRCILSLCESGKQLWVQSLPLQKELMVYYWIPLNTLQYHSVPLDHSMIFQQVSLVLSVVILNTIQYHWPVQWIENIIKIPFRYHSNSLGHNTPSSLGPQSRDKIRMMENGGPITGCLIHRITLYSGLQDVYVWFSFPVLPIRKLKSLFK